MSRLISDWELVFSSSRVNGGEYHGDSLPVIGWPRVTGTWLQKRLAKLRAEELARLKADNKKNGNEG